MRLGDSICRVIDNRGKTPPFTEDKTDYELIEINAIVGRK